jgi:hypothetical protein
MGRTSHCSFWTYAPLTPPGRPLYAWAAQPSGCGSLGATGKRPWGIGPLSSSGPPAIFPHPISSTFGIGWSESITASASWNWGNCGGAGPVRSAAPERGGGVPIVTSASYRRARGYLKGRPHNAPRAVGPLRSLHGGTHRSTRAQVSASAETHRSLYLYSRREKGTLSPNPQQMRFLAVHQDRVSEAGRQDVVRRRPVRGASPDFRGR